LDDSCSGLSPPLRELAARLASADDLHAGVEAAAWVCLGTFPFYRASLALPGRRLGHCYVAASWAQKPEEELDGYDFSLKGHPLEKVARDGVAVVRPDPLGDHADPVLARLFRGEGKAEELGVPLELGGRRGLLIFASREKGRFGRPAQELAMDVGRLLALWVRPWAGPDAPHVLKDQYEGLLEGSLDGIAVLQGGYTVYANGSFGEIFGLADPSQTPFASLLAPESRTAFEQAVESLRRRSRLLPRLEVEARSAAGASLHLDLGVQRILYRGEPALLVQIHNATERAERELEVRAAHERLDALLQTLAHDIRGPLTNVVGFSDLLLEKQRSLPPEQVGEMLGVIARAGQSIKDLVEGLLEYSALGHDQSPLGEVPLGPLLAAVERELEGTLARTGGRLEYDGLPEAVGGRRVEIARVFRNLLENGLRYAKPGEPPRVRLGCRGEEDGYLVFCVEDNGVGLGPDEARKVFTLFHRGEGGGAGVGLAIVERIVRGHGGRVWAEGEPGRGSRFYVTLPKPSASEV
jgi:PAS domain S-box-containing protein